MSNAEVRNPYLQIRSIMETPILDEHKWSKIPEIPADAFFLDLEDSVPESGKTEARRRVLQHVSDPSYFEGRLTVARPNHLSTPWGRDDVLALADAGVKWLTYPKVQGVDDVHELQDLLRSRGADPDLFLIIETARSVLELEHLSAIPGVRGLMYGSADLGVDAGIPLHQEDGEVNQAFLFPRVKTVLAGAAFGLLTTDSAWVPNLRDLDEARRRIRACRDLGFGAAITFYPSHVGIINDVFSPSSEEIEMAQGLVETYEAAMSAGQAAVRSASGYPILIHDYHKAQAMLQRRNEAALVDG